MNIIFDGKACCATGHRILVNSQIIWKNLDSILIELIEKENYEVFISGMAIGFDTLFAKKVLELKKKYPHIKLVSAVPCRDQDAKWFPAQKVEYKELLSQADQVICLAEHFSTECMKVRNMFMVDNSSAVVAYLVRPSKGTKQTVNYAMKKNRVIHFVQDV